MASKRIGLAERKSQGARRPVDALFGTAPADVSAGETGSEERKGGTEGKRKRALVRQTYHMDPVIIEAIRIMEFESREGISTMVNRILREHIPDDVIRSAEISLMKRSGHESV